VDGAIGYTRSQTGTGEEDDGFTDSVIGLSFRLVDEFRTDTGVPTVTLRFAGTIAGSYDEGSPYSSGDGASGLEGALLIGRYFAGPRVGVHGGLGYRYRDGEVPNDLFGSIGGYVSLSERITAGLGYRRTQGLSGQDIGDPGFTFPGLKEISDNLEVEFGLTGKSGQYYGLTVARTLDGRNTGERWIVSLTVALTRR
jgi:hypothetical protein